mmetsp:Transcript_24625/g.53361  ORF Transcript_24625/g.53361 Transcript_24625/m.53361 type:complete len:204 (+) Transcript_24625:256-867(+)
MQLQHRAQALSRQSTFIFPQFRHEVLNIIRIDLNRTDIYPFRGVIGRTLSQRRLQTILQLLLSTLKMLVQLVPHVSPHPLGPHGRKRLPSQLAQRHRRQRLAHNRRHRPQHGQHPHAHIVHRSEVVHPLLLLLVRNIGQLCHHLLGTEYHRQLRIVVDAREPTTVGHPRSVRDFDPVGLGLPFSDLAYFLTHGRGERVATGAT